MMFKKLLILVFVISLMTQSKISWGENYNFRFTRWGMNQEEVIASEEKMDPVEKNEDLIRYKTRILRKNVELHYLFSEDRLVGAIYKLDDNYLNSEHFIQTYIEFKEALMKKYGQPSSDTTNWLNDTYKNERKKWGLALSLGHVEYASLWKTQNTAIECSLGEVNYYVLCLVEYWNTEYSHLSKKIKLGDKLDIIKKEDKFDPF